MRICDLDGIEQSSVMVIDDYTLYLHSIEDGSPMLIDYTHEPGENAENADALIGLAKRLKQPAGGDRIGTQLLMAGTVAA